MLEGVGVITQNEKDEFLLQLRDAKTAILTNQWCLIGGSREKGEDIEQTVRREVKEETNLDIVEMKYLKKFQFNSKEIGIFIAKVNTAKERIIKGEGKRIQFFNKSDLINLIDSLNYTNPYLKIVKEFTEDKV